MISQAVGVDVGALVESVAVAMLAAFFSALVMDLPMRRQSAGMVPAYTAAGAVLGRSPDAVDEPLARSVHYSAAIAAGALFALLAAGLELVVPSTATVLGVAPLPHLGAAVLTLGFLYGFFGYLVLPRFGTAAARARADLVRRQWLGSATVFVIALAVLAPVGRFLLVG